MIARERYLRQIRDTLRRNPVCSLLGPRQCGKTTLARQIAKTTKTHYFDLESPAARDSLANPELVLGDLKGLIVIDEIQRQPELFTVLRPLADRERTPARFLVLGSASPTLVRSVSESLAGRVGFVDLGGFNLEEVGAANWKKLWLRGGFPRSYLALRAADSAVWRRDFFRTFLERDLPLLAPRVNAERLRRFWMMLAHYHGQLWGAAEPARSLGVTEPIVRDYLDILTGSFLIRQLQPWFENIGKRQHKSPKVYFRDSGLLHALLGVLTMQELLVHPKCGASWEGFALEQILAQTGDREAYCWGTHAGAELDLVLFHRGKRFGFEFKFQDSPRMTKSLHIALEDLKLEKAWIVYPGRVSYPVHPKVRVVSLPGAMQVVKKWK